MIQLSIVIVNYNVKHFLIKCLESIERADKSNFNLEVIVVDNASIDGSVAAVKHKFPKIKIIESESNLGFSKANNLGFNIAKGDYILALNPDTIIQEDTLIKCLEFMAQNPDCGVMGVKMIDGSGNYLPESKRGKPDLWNSLCKFSGLTALFPKNAIFSGYYMGHLDENKIQKVEVLCGAFMFFRSQTLKEMEGFDEDYFMYGEDIDLSQKIIKAGWNVVYFPETRIIHFKGESTKKTSLNYIRSFYSAMSIYVGKNYHGWQGNLMKALIKLSIFFSAILSFIKNNFLSHLPILIDGFLSWLFIVGTGKWWAAWYFGNKDYYENSAAYFNSIGSVFFWMIALWFFGHYDKNWKMKRQLTGIGVGTLAILLIYALLPTSLRTSRALIFIGTITVFFVSSITRIFGKKLKFLLSKNGSNSRYIVVANEPNANRISKTISDGDSSAQVVGVIFPALKPINLDPFFLSSLSDLHKVVKTMRIDNIVFSNDDLSLQQILDLMVHSDKDVKCYITGGDVDTVLSSQNKNSKGTFLHAESNYKLSQGLYLRIKRTFDLTVSLFFILFFPVLYFFSIYKNKIFPSIFDVATGRKTWVGYNLNNTAGFLPEIAQGVISIDGLVGNYRYYPIITDTIQANTYYARNYSVWLDIFLLYQQISTS